MDYDYLSEQVSNVLPDDWKPAQEAVKNMTKAMSLEADRHIQALVDAQDMVVRVANDLSNTTKRREHYHTLLTQLGDGNSTKRDPDFGRTFEQIVVENGFFFESHEVNTDDGYILNMFRIKTQEAEYPVAKPAVFLQHGVTDSADCWIMNYPSVAPAFKLLRAGYDVWLGNQRGIKYSLGHKTLDWKTDEKYWEFSFTEMGNFDAPA